MVFKPLLVFNKGIAMNVIHTNIQNYKQKQIKNFTQVQPQNYKSSKIQSEFISNKEERKTNKSRTIIVCLGLITAVGIGVAKLKTRANRVKILKSIPEEMKTLFREINAKSGDEFVNCAYQKLIKMMNLENIAPPKVITKDKDGLFCVTGGYDLANNTISFSEGFSSLDQAKKLGMLAHELKHCEQETRILRTEGLGAEKLARAFAERNIYNAIQETDFRNILFKSAYDKAVLFGKGKDFLEKAITQNQKKILDLINQNCSEILKMPKIKIDSAEGKKAYEHLEAIRNYKGLDMFGLSNDAYKNNPLEVEAYAFGDKIEEMYQNYLNVIAKM